MANTSMGQAPVVAKNAPTETESMNSNIEKIKKSFNLGLVSCLICPYHNFARKTLFVNQLTHALDEDGFISAYFNFSGIQDSTKTFIEFLGSLLNHQLFNSPGAAGIPCLSGTVEFEKLPMVDWGILEILSTLGCQSIGRYKKLILILDNAQELQNSAEGLALVAGLRTALDRNKESVGAIFLGASRNGLSKMFNSPHAPFFHFGMWLDGFLHPI